MEFIGKKDLNPRNFLSSRLFLILKTFGKAEPTRFLKFLKSPYFNHSDSLIKLFKSIRVFHPDYVDDKLTKEALFKKVFPKTPFHRRKITDLLSDLTLLLDDFLIVQHIFNDNEQKSKLRITAYEKRNLYPLFEKKINQILEKEEKSPLKNRRYYQEILDFNERLYIHPNTLSFISGLNLPFKIMKNLDAAFILGKLQYSCELFNRQKALSEEHEILFLEEVKKYVSRSVVKDNHLVDIYLDILQLSEEVDNFNLFQKIKNQFLESLETTALYENRAILQSLINHSISRINAGDEFYKEAQFELYKTGFEKKILILEDKLSDVAFINLVVLSAGLKEFKWTEDFIRDYRKYIDIDEREAALNLSNAFLFFALGKYKDTHEFLQILTLSNDRLKIWSYSLTMRTYYELCKNEKDYDQLLESQIEKFTSFINRKKQQYSENRIIGYRNYINFVKRLVKARSMIEMDKSLCTNLKKELKEVLQPKKILIAKSWLLDKIEELC